MTAVQLDGGEWREDLAPLVSRRGCIEEQNCEYDFDTCVYHEWPNAVVYADEVIRVRTERPIQVGSKITVYRDKFNGASTGREWLGDPECDGSNMPCRPTGRLDVYLSKKAGSRYYKRGPRKLFRTEEFESKGSASATARFFPL